MSKPFKFKQFTVLQDRCAMKIGTDSVLLGAWTSLSHQPDSILDIGAGTGVLSLMMAQRSDALLIDALEIEDDAYEQCSENFENSPWADRLFCYHASLNEFAEEFSNDEDLDQQYDLIICNPPFYSEDFKTLNSQRDLARFQDAMPFADLLSAVRSLLSPNGVFSVVAPFSEEEKFVTMAKQNDLFQKRILHVKGKSDSEIKRSLMEFSFQKGEISSSQLTIEIERHVYTEDYINLTKEFYINM